VSPPGLLVLAPLRLEARAVRTGLRAAGLPTGCVRRTGMGPRRSRAGAAPLLGPEVTAVAVAGFCGAVDPRLRVGDVVVADRVDGPAGGLACPSAGTLAGALAGRDLTVRTGPVRTVARPAVGHRRAAVTGDGALAVDMESAVLAGLAEGRPLAVLRVVLDSPSAELFRPGLPAALRTARRVLAAAAPALATWASAVTPPSRITVKER
jgi:4-hydroxy-3-methylbut-2-enyl diphosphate reductase